MGLILKTNTSVRITVGPFISITDGYTEKTAMTPSNIKLNIWKDMDDGSAPTKTANDVSLTASAGANDLVELSNGYYDLELTGTQLNFVGRGRLQLYDVDQFLPYWEELFVVAGDVYNALMGLTGGKIGADVKSVANGAITALSIVDGAITNAKVADDVAVHTKTIEANAITAAALAADAVSEIQNGLATETTATAIKGKTDLIPAAPSTLTAADVWGYAAGAGRSLTTFGTLVTDIATSVWGKLTSALTGEGTIGKYILDYLDGKISEISVTGGNGLTAQETRDAMQLAPTAGTPGEGSVDAELDAIKTAIDNLTPPDNTTITQIKTQVDKLQFDESNNVLAVAEVSIDESALAQTVVEAMQGNGDVATPVVVEYPAGVPHAGVEVHCSLTEGGASIASGYTNDVGTVVFYLSRNTAEQPHYYITIQHPHFENEVVEITVV